jgi:hypothetical protein
MNNYIKFRDKVLKITPLPIKQLLKLFLVKWLKLGRIIFPDREWLPGWTTQMKVISSLFIVAILSISYYLFQSNFDFAEASLNFGTEILGAVITYILIQNVIGNSKKKEKLITNMSSKTREVALQATEELRQSNWLTDGSLKGVNLSGANLRGFELNSANLIDAVLINTNLSGAKLFGAKLSGANLFLADLSNATLDSADLHEANLQGTNLYGADLSTVHNLNSATLKGAWYSDKTKWPDGFDPETAGAILVYIDGKRVYPKTSEKS